MFNKVFSQNIYTIHKLPGAVNSKYEEIKPISSADGDSLFFLRSYSPYNKGGENSEEDIWLSIYRDELGWSEAVNTFGYHNKPGPDIFAGLSSGANAFYILDYLASGQTRSIKIVEYQILEADNLKKISESLTGIEIGNDYHDIYIDPGGTILLISMNALNSLGLEDIYISFKNNEGTWSYAQNLGPVINTRGFEISPFFSEDGKTLYFASDGHGGLGDADIYYSQRLDKGWQNWTVPVNMGAPINSSFFDAYLSVNDNHDLFFVSNRNGQYSDIFKATVNEKINPNATKNDKYDEVSSVLEDASDVEKMADNNLNASLYFEFDDFKLKKEELDKLEVFLKKMTNPLRSYFKIYGYTDNSGSLSYNQKLSERRAKFVYKYLRKKGIDDDRLYMEGKGILITTDEYEVPSSAKRKVEISVVRNSK